jgi:hypothetical protein
MTLMVGGKRISMSKAESVPKQMPRKIQEEAFHKGLIPYIPGERGQR